MDSNYIINRLKTTLYKYPTAEVLRTRLQNMDPESRKKVLTNLKMELHKQNNEDIVDPLTEVVYSSVYRS
jgi:glycine cleavage system regulatory protein